MGLQRLTIGPGYPHPLGASLRGSGVNVAVVSSGATSVNLCLHAPGVAEPFQEAPLIRTGDVWHCFVEGAGPGLEYSYRVQGATSPVPARAPDRRPLLLDPCAVSVAGAEAWLEPGSPRPRGPRVRPRRARVVDTTFDWDGDRPPAHHPADSVVYEAHVRGFTRHPSAAVAHPGTYLGLAEKAGYLRELGVTAVELLPVHEFEEDDHRWKHPRHGHRLTNFWGYQPLSFRALKAGYAARPGQEIREFQEMVRALHGCGIEVILDVVYNHTGEMDEVHGTTVSWRGLDDSSYYLLEAGTGKYRDHAGCGNTVNANHPVTRGLILDSLRHFVSELHVDGFRFDLASILTRGEDGDPLGAPPLVEAIARDPVLSHVKLIAEAWDAAGLYQVGGFPHHGRFAEWNGRFRDDVRRFLRGDAGTLPGLATRLAGSSDLYQGAGRPPWHSLNFVTCHDGFTLHDLVSYERKHNADNGHDGQDGTDDNLSANWGVEGETAAPAVRQVRARQQRNALVLLFLAQGTPMLLGGDELSRTQGGNNNAYCQDGETSWVNWEARDADLGLFARRLIRFRRAHRSLRRRSYVEPGDAPWAVWHGLKPGRPDWKHSRVLGLQLLGLGRDDEILLLVNGEERRHRFELPPLPPDRHWRRFVDTGQAAPADSVEPGDEPALGTRHTIDLMAHATVVLVGR